MPEMVSGMLGTLYNRRLKIYQHHDFDRDATGHVAAGWQDKVPLVRQKFRTIFESYWRDFEEAQHPVFVIGGIISFRELAALTTAGLSAPSFDIGTILDARENTLVEPPFYWGQPARSRLSFSRSRRRP